MKHSRTIRPLAAVAALCLSLFAAQLAIAQQNEQGRGERRGPPQEAFAACADLSEESQCSFQGKRGEALSGTCIVPPRGEASLVCAPADRQQGQGGDFQPRNTES